MKYQRGQSLIEMAIACIVMVPMFVGVMLLGQYIHLHQQTQAAARAAASKSSILPATGAGTISGLAFVRMTWSGVTTPRRA